MTHKEIYTKYMIEYDKANITSSYPSLTEYEIATVLDKAYLALINQKITGNNVRKSVFEQDLKSISDLQPLIVTVRINFGNNVAGGKKGLLQFPKTELFWESSTSEYSTRNQHSIGINVDRPTEYKYISTSARSIPDNVRELKIPDDMLYYVSGAVPVDIRLFSGWMNDVDYTKIKSGVETDSKDDNADVTDYEHLLIPMDNKLRDYLKWNANKIGEAKHYRMVPVKLVSHDVAEKFFATAYNIPWVKTPVAYLENNYLFVVVDPIVGIAELPYEEDGVKEAGASVEEDDCAEWMSITYVKIPAKFAKLTPQQTFEGLSNDNTKFELNDSVAEELISLAISYSLENVESPRLNTHLGIRGLES